MTYICYYLGVSHRVHMHTLGCLRSPRPMWLSAAPEWATATPSRGTHWHYITFLTSTWTVQPHVRTLFHFVFTLVTHSAVQKRSLTECELWWMNNWPLTLSIYFTCLRQYLPTWYRSYIIIDNFCSSTMSFIVCRCTDSTFSYLFMSGT